MLKRPSQYSQPSKKGKKAWRKHVNIGEIEEGLETLREEEILTGTQIHKKADQELFQVDTVGDQQLRRSLPKYDRSLLLSSKILSQRSAIPPVLSRPSTKHLPPLTHAEKTRLLRIGRRKVKGPFNTFVDPGALGAGSAILEPTEAVQKSGTYDVWAETSDTPSVKLPNTDRPHRSIDLPAIVPPHEGTSYNPLHNAHTELMLSAHKVELRRQRKETKLEGVAKRIKRASYPLGEEAGSGAPGMALDDGNSEMNVEDDVGGVQDSEVPTHRMPLRKTQKQRRKAAQVRAERRALLHRRHQRRLLAAVPSARSLRTKVAALLRARQAALEARRAARAELLKQRGLIGQKLGKHRVMEGEIDVQLGDELSETLRGLKPQGNLFRDRFLSLQHRALLEPRVRVLPTRRKTKIKHYEKHAWKRFE